MRRLILRLVLGFVAASLALAALLVIRARSLPSLQPRVEPVSPVPLVAEPIVSRFAEALRHRTLSTHDPAAQQPFDALSAHLERSYPKFFALPRRRVGGAEHLVWA